MMRFTLGMAICCFAFIIGAYLYFENEDLLTVKTRGLRDVEEERDAGKNLQNRIRNIRKISMVQGDDQKFTIERLLDIGAPGMELRFVGQPRTSGSSRALYRHTFRIQGPTTYGDTLEVLQKMANLPGFTVYKYCFACSKPPKGTPEEYQMVQIEGYLYVYDPNVL